MSLTKGDDMKKKYALARFLSICILYGTCIDTVHSETIQEVLQRCKLYTKYFVETGRRENISAEMLMALSATESLCVPDTVTTIKSNTGEYARGMMQMLPSTFKETKIEGDLLTPRVSISAAGRYITMLRTYGYRYTQQLLIAYGRGPGEARKHVRDGKDFVHPYVKRVLRWWKRIGYLKY